MYSLVSLVPSVGVIRESGARSTPRLAGALELSALYGLDNELHLGGTLRFAGLKNVAFPSANALLHDGSLLNGMLYEDSLQVGIGVSAAWRFDFSA